MQPATTNVNPPSPLATVYTDLTGDTPIIQPVLTDGFGHSDAYMDDTTLYTVVIWHPLFGENPVVLKDQAPSNSGGGSAGLTAFSGTPSGPINGSNTVFTFAVPQNPVQVIVWLNFPLVVGVGYTVSWVSGTLTITYANAPQPSSGSTPADVVYVQGFY
jgi:hypothetical protein